MTGIINGLQNLWNGILAIVNGIVLGINFLMNLIKSLFQLLRMLVTTVTNTTILIQTLPSWLIAFATASVSIAVLYIILGRESGK